MPTRLLPENDLAAYAKQCRLSAGKTKVEIAALLGVSRVSVQQAEENPEQHLSRLRIRIIEACSNYAVEGPVYRLIRRR
jgi:DNA-binding XRE family transcriptional regulator